ncbi:hypothetical protein ACHAWF_011890 [Thalassiosira exigua]
MNEEVNREAGENTNRYFFDVDDDLVVNSRNLPHHSDSSKHFYFDAMEVLYFDDMLQQTETIRSSSEDEEDDSLSIGSEHDKDRENNIVSGLSERVRSIRLASRHNRKKLRKMAHEKRIVLENELRSRRKKLRQIMSQSAMVLTKDKISFVCGVIVIMVIEAVLLLAPKKMGSLYAALLVPSWWHAT